MDRQSDAAAAYGRAVALARAQGVKDEVWPLLLVQAGALEEAHRWPEARTAVQQALAIAPEQPLLLNFLGYTELVHGENVNAAEAMIRKASALAPNDASITDSLGWAQFKRGKVADAIATLQSAAERILSRPTSRSILATPCSATATTLRRGLPGPPRWSRRRTTSLPASRRRSRPA